MRRCLWLLIPLLAVGCSKRDGSSESGGSPPANKEEKAMALTLSTAAFTNGERIPVTHTADGADLSPHLTWGPAPRETRSFALICDDPDAPMGTWVHWVIFNIPGSSAELSEGIRREGRLPDGSLQGRNSWERTGYGGPSPPPGKPHRYFFKLYALDATLDLDSAADKEILLKAMEGHILGKGEIMGTYGR